MLSKTVRWWLVVAVVGMAALVPAAASADGGSSIATAPTVAYGQQQIGNTATGALHKDCCGGGTFYSFWGLPVLAGDEVTIDWESVARETDLKLMPVGTTDYTFQQTEEAAHDYLKGNNKSQLRYRAPVSGVLPMAFEIEDNDNPGPYAFTASVQHVLFAALTPTANVYKQSVVAGSATLADGRPAPDGLVFFLVAKWHNSRGMERSTVSAVTVAGGLSFQLALPPETIGRVVRLSITRGADVGFQATRSTPANVHVARAQQKAKKRCPKGFKKKHVRGETRCVRKAAKGRR